MEVTLKLGAVLTDNFNNNNLEYQWILKILVLKLGTLYS